MLQALEIQEEAVISEMCYPDDSLGIASLDRRALSILPGGFISQ